MKDSAVSHRMESDPDFDFSRRERRLEAIRSQAFQTGQMALPFL